MHDEMTRHSFVNVWDYGAVGNGESDDTEAIKLAIHSVPHGGTIYFPPGKYLITGSLGIPRDNFQLIGSGKGSVLHYRYDQREEDSSVSSSLFVFREGASGIAVRHLKLEYEGQFFPNPGESYAGKISALRFQLCQDVLVEDVEISGFNANGIEVITGSPLKYAKRFKVRQCYLHHNRVSGVAFGNVDGISITDCDLEHNGSPLDGGTGYGCCGSSSEVPLRIQIIGNRASYNCRKGIDLHSGIGAIIEGNICHANKLYGIYAEGRNTGNITIRGNIISGMQWEAPNFPAPYTWITGIDFGPYAESNVPELYHHYLIEGNQIVDFGMENGNAYPIHCYYNFQNGSVIIRNNIIQAGSIDHLVSFGAESAGGREKVMVNVSGNQATIGHLRGDLFRLSDGGSVTVNDNQIMT